MPFDFQEHGGGGGGEPDPGHDPENMERAVHQMLLGMDMVAVVTNLCSQCLGATFAATILRALLRDEHAATRDATARILEELLEEHAHTDEELNDGQP